MADKKDHITRLVNFIIIINVTFAAIILAVFWCKESTPDTLITCWYTFFGAELVAMATIKVADKATKRKGESGFENYTDATGPDGEGPTGEEEQA